MNLVTGRVPARNEAQQAWTDAPDPRSTRFFQLFPKFGKNQSCPLVQSRQQGVKQQEDECWKSLRRASNRTDDTVFKGPARIPSRLLLPFNSPDRSKRKRLQLVTAPSRNGRPPKASLPGGLPFLVAQSPFFQRIIPSTGFDPYGDHSPEFSGKIPA